MDHELIDRAARGDPLAVRTLYERHSAQVFSAVRRILGDDHRSEDCAQEAWISALKALDSFRRDARFSTWIHRIAINQALQMRRRSGQRRAREVDLPDQIPVHPPAHDVLLEDRLSEALHQVPERMRQVLILHDVEGYTHQEIGEMLGVAPGTSKSQLFKARARMRELLRQTRADTEDTQEGVEA